jgi:hypothetical protein
MGGLLGRHGPKASGDGTFLLARTRSKSILDVVRGAVEVTAERGAAVPDPWNLIRIMPAKG